MSRFSRRYVCSYDVNVEYCSDEDGQREEIGRGRKKE